MPTIKEEMTALDRRNFNWYKNLSEEDRKSLSMWVLMRYASAAESKVTEINHHYLSMVNEFVNVHFNALRHHPELQWRLLQVCAVGTPQFHPWIQPGKNKKVAKTNKKLFDFFVARYPQCNDDEIMIMIDSMSQDNRKQLLVEAGLDDKAIKEYLK